MSDQVYVQDQPGLVESLFPTLVYWAFVGRQTNIQTEIDALYPKLEFRYANNMGDGPVGPRPAGYTAGWGKTHKLNVPLSADDEVFTQDLLTELPMLADALDQHINHYLDALGWEARSYRRTAWMTGLDEGDYIHQHTHRPSDLTGVYFYKAIPDDGVLTFMVPTPGMAQDPTYENVPQTWEHQPVEGKLILFPAWLTHGVGKTLRSDHTRHSISWNIEFNGVGQ